MGSCIALMSVRFDPPGAPDYYPGFSKAAIRRSSISRNKFLPGTHLLHLVECGKCRSMSCQRTLVRRRDSNRGPCDRQSGDVSTRPQHLYTCCIMNPGNSCQLLKLIHWGLATWSPAQIYFYFYHLSTQTIRKS